MNGNRKVIRGHWVKLKRNWKLTVGELDNVRHTFTLSFSLLFNNACICNLAKSQNVLHTENCKYRGWKDFKRLRMEKTCLSFNSFLKNMFFFYIAYNLLCSIWAKMPECLQIYYLNAVPQCISYFSSMYRFQRFSIVGSNFICKKIGVYRIAANEVAEHFNSLRI